MKAYLSSAGHLPVVAVLAEEDASDFLRFPSIKQRLDPPLLLTNGSCTDCGAAVVVTL